ncbi:hypothetical protein [Desulfosediminicola sp.]|uniref:hypothetical protein n=1 Tax=Desulfosediminicola sp. TaxID=2886825 RepID=UPI003AF215ED
MSRCIVAVLIKSAVFGSPVMSLECSLHRARPAHFVCYECGTSLCDECVSTRVSQGYGGKEKNYFCPACDSQVQLAGLGNVMVPFWHRLSSVFLYPFQLVPLILTAVLSLLAAVFPTNILVSLGVWVIMMKYAYAVLIETGRGSLNAPGVSVELINQDVMQVLKQYLVFALLGGSIGFVASHSVMAAIFLGVLAIACLPMILMLLVSTNSVLQALNPMLFVPIIFRIGWPYLLMYLFLAFFMAAPAAFFAYLPVEVIPPLLYAFVISFVSQCYTIMSYHLMGYVLLQYHDRIGYVVDYEFFIENQGGRAKRKPKSAEEDLKTGLSILVKNGKYREALDKLLPFVKQKDPDWELSEKFYQLLNMSGEQDKALRYSVRHFEVLVKNNRKKQATELFPKITASPTAPPAAGSVFAMAGWCEEMNDFKSALNGYVYFTKHFKNDPLLPEVYFKLAMLLHEKGRKSDKARQILRGIIKAFPGHDLTPKAMQYLKAVG